MGQLKRALIEREENARLNARRNPARSKNRSRVMYVATPTVGLAKRITGEHEEE
jgi:hypothetical protein